MTDEEKMKFLASLGASGGKIQVILEQNIGNNIENVGDGGVAVQNNYYGSAAKPKSDKGKKTSDGNKMVSTTFVYKYYNSDEGKRRLTRFYQQLLAAKWIDANSMPDTFLEIFSGKASDAKIKWTGKKSYLYYLVKTMIARQLVRCATGDEHWTVTQSHFVDSNSRTFSDLHREKEPKTAMLAIDKLIDILDPAVEDEE